MTDIRISAASLVFAAALLTAGNATAASPLGDLLKAGWIVVDTEVIDKDVINRTMSHTEWVDDLLITLQKDSGIAFCHIPLVSTSTDPNVLINLCHVVDAAATPAQ